MPVESNGASSSQKAHVMALAIIALGLALFSLYFLQQRQASMERTQKERRAVLAREASFTESLGLGRAWSIVRQKTRRPEAQPVSRGLPWDEWYDTSHYSEIPGVEGRCPTSFAVKNGRVVAVLPAPERYEDGAALLQLIKDEYGWAPENEQLGVRSWEWEIGNLRIEATDSSGQPGATPEAAWSFEFAEY